MPFDRHMILKIAGGRRQQLEEILTLVRDTPGVQDIQQEEIGSHDRELLESAMKDQALRRSTMAGKLLSERALYDDGDTWEIRIDHQSWRLFLTVLHDARSQFRRRGGHFQLEQTIDTLMTGVIRKIRGGPTRR